MYIYLFTINIIANFIIGRIIELFNIFYLYIITIL
jgi:hypothetical protein